VEDKTSALYGGDEKGGDDFFNNNLGDRKTGGLPLTTSKGGDEMVHKRRLLILVFSIVASLALVLPIAVPEAAADGENFVTGGGQITDGKQIGYKVSFAGYVGYMEDSSLVEGEWQTNFHNVSEVFLVGARFHSTSIISLEFYQDNDWVPPDDANANVAQLHSRGQAERRGWLYAECLAG